MGAVCRFSTAAIKHRLKHRLPIWTQQLLARQHVSVNVRAWSAGAIASLGVIGLYAPTGYALSRDTMFLLTEPLAANTADPNTIPHDGSVVTNRTISQEGLTVPSLWWTQQQFGGKLLDRWFAYVGSDGTPRRVDLVINNQVWNAADYLQRYQFVNHFGTESQGYGFNVRVFNARRELLAAYICEDNPKPPTVFRAEVDNPDAIYTAGFCNIFLDSSGQGALDGTF